MAHKEPIYRIIFTQQEKIYTVYSRYISDETLLGFIEADQLIFETGNGVVVDPAEERLCQEFEDVKRCYIPMHTIVRIDEVTRYDQAKFKEISGDNITHFPASQLRKNV